jgi:hypothetical protein
MLQIILSGRNLSLTEYEFKVFKNEVLCKVSGPKGSKQAVNGRYCVTENCVICTINLVLLG